MAGLTGTNPISGQDVDATSPSTWLNYAVGGTVLVAGVMAGKFVADTASEATGTGEKISDAILSVS